MFKHQGPHFAESALHRHVEMSGESPYSWFVFGLAAVAITLVFGVSLFIQIS
jgi:hypothetical protein